MKKNAQPSPETANEELPKTTPQKSSGDKFLIEFLAELDENVFISTTNDDGSVTKHRPSIKDFGAFLKISGQFDRECFLKALLNFAAKVNNI